MRLLRIQKNALYEYFSTRFGVNDEELRTCPNPHDPELIAMRVFRIPEGQYRP